MDGEIRDCVLGMVAGMRGEKRAARAAAARRLLSALKRGKSLLTGSHLKRLESHRGIMSAHHDRVLRGPYARAEDTYKALYNRDPLRPSDLSGRRGDLDYVPRKYVDPSTRTIDDYRLSAELKPKIDRAADEFARVDGLLHGLYAAGRATDGRILREARAIRNARLAAGGLGAVGLGGAGYGTYKAVSGKKGDTKEASMHKELHDIVLAKVAGMRGEKRAESAAREEAYAAGFCKAAELAGVSPRSAVRRCAMAKAAQQVQPGAAASPAPGWWGRMFARPAPQQVQQQGQAPQQAAPQQAAPQQGQQQGQLPQQVAENFPARGGTSAFGNYYLENAGQVATLGEGAALGAALGSQRANRLLSRIKLRGFKGKGIGALAGLSVGMMANMFGKGKSMVTRGRTAQDQIDHDVALNFRNLLPGVGAYNAGKRQERVQLSQWHG